MSSLNNILVIVDPTVDEHPAVAKAARLAQAFGARLELFICETKAAREARLAVHSKRDPAQPLVVSSKAVLEQLASPLRSRGIDVTTECECSHAPQQPLHVALIDRVRRTTAGLVVKDTHHHSIAQRTFLSNTDWELIRHCPVPLLLTKSGSWSATPKIVAAVDPNHVNDKPASLDARILDLAASIAHKLGGELHALHAYVPAAIVAAAAASTPPMAMGVSATEIAAEEQLRRSQLLELVKDHSIATARVHIEMGGPAEVLPHQAGVIGADIMAMGAIARSGLRRIFVGSTAEDVLEHLPCDALVIKPADFAALLPF